jgi:hypothetical protein
MPEFIRRELQRISIGGLSSPPYYRRTASEKAASVTIANYAYPPGYVYRYGSGRAAVQAAIDQQKFGGPETVLSEVTETIDSALTLYESIKISGHGTGKSVLNYTGSGALFQQSTPGTRIYNLVLRDFSMVDSGTGTIGLDLDSVSQSESQNLTVTGFTTGVKIYAPTAGYAVYNRFWNVKVQSATTGFRIHGTSANANALFGCRSNICTTGALIEDSNDNTIISSQFESGGDGIGITASIPGISPRNYIACSRFEGNSGTNIIIGTDVNETALFANFHATGVALSDSGTRTQIFDTQATKTRLSLHDASASTDGPAFTFTRSTNAGSSVPVTQINDTNTGSGTPNTLEINTERNAGKSLTIKRATVEQFSVTPAGVVAATNFIPDVVTFANADATPTVAGGDVFITTGTTAITDFDNGVVGQTIKIKATDNITITYNASIIKLAGAVDYAMTADDTLTLTMFVDQVWQETGRAVI